MLLLKPIFFSVATGLTVIAFAGFAANTTPKTVVLAKDASFSLPSPQGQLKGINTRLIAQKQPRVALVIGNANYEEGALSNPVNDATDMAKALRELDFEVTLLQNQDLRSMETAINDFSRQLRKGGVGVFYYAGHGVQVEGENYLIPLKAQLLNEKDARYEAVALGKVLNAMEEARNQVNIIIIDACRDNPFYRRWRSSRRGSNVRGLTAVSPPSGIIIAYATREGNTAADGVGQRNSPFTSALLENIKKPNIDVQLMFRRVSTSVKEKTNAVQQPWTEGNLEGDEFYLNPQQTVVVSPPPFSPPPVTPSPVVTPQPTPPTQPRSTLISSTTGVDYTTLRELLQQKKWQEADQKTWDLMLTAANRQKEEWLDIESVNKFSCEDLRMIDREWLAASGGQFGFSVQLAIYKQTGNPIGDYNEQAYARFGDAVGWRVNGKWKTYSDIVTWSTNAPSSAPKGHLPCCVGFGCGEGGCGFGKLNGA
ncbi:MAG: peptidase C14 [Microcystis aeruginosa W13-15]|nr:peptidase C14 [Microcystis aeruginosa W13-16]NCQ74221.1 peptidase C14 [Microcystis aeruginosa W13-13]NCQ78671.1 peptidase C14 [Microcystis aeruginosa W13-15]